MLIAFGQARHLLIPLRCSNLTRHFATSRRGDSTRHPVPPPPSPPIESSGHWIEREKFPGDKSFGYFFCFTCAGKSAWISAHAFKRYKQGCKTCDTYFLPVYMWVNDHGNDSNEYRDIEESEKKPHKRDLCEACRLGQCHK